MNNNRQNINNCTIHMLARCVFIIIIIIPITIIIIAMNARYLLAMNDVNSYLSIDAITQSILLKKISNYH